MMIDDGTLKQLLRINDELFKVCKWLNERRDLEISSRLIPVVDDLTYILLEAGKNKLQRTEDADAEHSEISVPRGSLGGAHIFHASLLNYAYAASLHASYTLCRQSGT